MGKRFRGFSPDEKKGARMGREARCACRWNGRDGEVTILLEASVLIVRGDFSARVPTDGLRAEARAETLDVTIANEPVTFALGAERAKRWAAAIAAPQPTLASKLGIAETTRLHVIGRSDDAELSAALAVSKAPNAKRGSEDLCIIRTDDPTALNAWAKTEASRTNRSPVWIVYTKGRGAPLGERAARTIMRDHGFVDTKVAGVSERLTARRFVTNTSRKAL
jgi:hypothetical protein